MQPPPGAKPVATVTVSPPSGSLASIGEKLELSASAQDEDGTALSGRTFTWSTSDEGVATVDPSGEVAAVANGTATITASTGGVDGQATVDVSQQPGRLSFVVEPARTAIGVPFAGAVEVEVVDALGTLVPDASIDVSVALDANDASAMLTGTTTRSAVDGHALFDDLAVDAAGRGFTIAASSGALTPARSASFDVLSGLPAVDVRFPDRGVTISGIGTTLDVQLEADDANGDPTMPPTTTWSSLNPDVLTVTSVDATTGRLTAQRDGQVTVAADAGGPTDDMLVTVVVPGPADPVTWEWGDFNANYLEDVWATSASDVWAVGWGGTVLHYDGFEWTDRTPGLTSQDLIGVWASGPSDVWAVGLRGVVLHFDGVAWETVSDGVFENVSAFNHVSGTGPNDVWVVGTTLSGAMSLVHFDGVAWTDFAPTAPDPASYLLAAWAVASDDVWAVGQDGAVIRFDGTAWTEAGPSLASHVHDVFGSGADDVWVLTGTAAWHFDGATWSNRSSGLSGTAAGPLWAGWATGPDDVWATPRHGDGMWRFDGTSWGPVPVPWEINGAEAVGGSGATDVWAVSLWGEIAYYDGNEWTNRTARRTTGTPEVMWGSSANDIWGATGGDGLVHYDGLEWTETDGHLFQIFRGMWGSAAADIWAVGYGGATVHYDGVSWTPVAHGLTTAILRDVWGSAPDDVWTVSSEGGVLRFDGTQWATEPVAVPVTDLRGVWGTSDSDVWLVGANGDLGAVLHYDGTAISDRSPPFEVDVLNTVWGTGPDDVWVAGDGVELLHFDGTSWVAVVHGYEGSHEKIWGTGPQDVWALGRRGGCCPRSSESLYHYDGTTWRDETPAHLTWTRFNSIWGTRTGPIWAWGHPGALVRGSR